MSSDRIYIEQYRLQVQRHLMLGDGDGKLRQRDFEYLSDHIEQSAGVRLSISTLKRLWRDDVTQLPHPSTLNALAAALGYADWATFKQSHIITPPLAEADKGHGFFATVKTRVWLGVAASILAIITIALLAAGSNFSARKSLILPENIPFSADKTVTIGVPNTVEFRYDVSGIDADSFFIQQSWDYTNREPIDPDKHYRSSTYYYPGFHRAKLIVNDSIVARSRIHIKTDGWFSLADYNEGNRKPIYLNGTADAGDGTWHVSKEVLAAHGMDGTEPYLLRYFNIRDFDNVTSDDFSLRANVRSDRAANVSCPFVQIVLIAEENVFFMQATAKGCLGELELKFGETYQRARDTDLSGLGRDLYAWQNFRIENKRKAVSIFANDTLVHSLRYQENFGKIVGIVFWFNGPAAIDDVQLLNGKNEMVYQDSFNVPNNPHIQDR
jgi:hypothetical protein